MATVYLAEHVLLQQERALKIMSPELVNQPGFKESFLREGQIIATLKHPGIISVHDIGHHDNHYYMVMEYLHGGSLEEQLQSQSITLSKALEILQQVGAALHYAHQSKLLHRDIKPANILFDSDNNAVLTDFGISKIQGTNSDLTQMGYGMIGTPRYMSPEQTGGQYLDARSDLYSLALVFYEMLSGEPAIKSGSTAAIIREHAIAPPPCLPENYVFLQPVLNKALAKEPGERFPDVLSFIQALVRADSQDGKTIIQPSGTEENKERKSSTPLFVILFLCLSITAVIGWWLVSYSGGDRAKPTEAEPVEAEPVEAEPVEAEPVEAKPVEAKPTEAKPTETEMSNASEEKIQQSVKLQTIVMIVRIAPYTVLYKEPNGQKTLRIRQGEAVHVIKNSMDSGDGEWYEVDFMGQRGYLKAKHLKARNN